MKNCLKYLLMTLVATIGIFADASAVEARHDTIYFYESWKQMLDLQPVAMIEDPVFVPYSDCEVFIETGIDETNDMIKEKFIAFSLGDSLWYMNSEYLKKNFKGDTKNMDGFFPVFFNEKIAYVISYSPLSVKDVLFGTNVDGVTERNSVDNYHIDFLNHRVNRVTHEYLSSLLEDYHDLLMRYEGMKDYKKIEIIEDYFFKYIDRATDDIMRPYIVDLVE